MSRPGRLPGLEAAVPAPISPASVTPDPCAMPIYAFRCDACGHSFDRLQKLADPDPQRCPTCDAGPVRRQVTAPAFRLGGNGWYETDFKKDGQRNVARKDDAPPAGGAKPAAGAEAAAVPEATPKHNCGAGCGCA